VSVRNLPRMVMAGSGLTPAALYRLTTDQRPTKRVAYAAENGDRTYIAFQYKCINISLPSAFSSGNPLMQRGP
jgi:hypothetical protein